VDDEVLEKKRQKAARYAAEPERFVISGIKLEMQSEHGTRSILYVGGKWHCNCDFFKEREICSHTMAAEQLPMLQDLPLKYPLGSLVGTLEHKEEV
jgi:hypothetical protein